MLRGDTAGKRGLRLKRSSGKTYVPFFLPLALFKVTLKLVGLQHALYFPDIEGTALADKQSVHTTDLCRGKVTVIGMLTTAISEVCLSVFCSSHFFLTLRFSHGYQEHVSSFTSLTNTTFLSQSHPQYQFLQINIQENPAKAFLVSLYLSSLRRKIPASLHPFYLLSKQNLEYERDAIGMNNKHIGFVYLVDEQCRVRWAGGGLALEEEQESLKRCVRVLLERLERKDGKEGQAKE